MIVYKVVMKYDISNKFVSAVATHDSKVMYEIGKICKPPEWLAKNIMEFYVLGL